MPPIDPSSAIWGYGFGRSSREEELREMSGVKEALRGKLVKDLRIEPLKSENGELLVKLENTGNVTIGYDDVLDDPDDIWFNKIVVRVYELFDEPIQEEKKILGVLKHKKVVDKKEVFKTTISGLKPQKSITLRSGVIVEPNKRYKIVVEEHYKEYIRNWFKEFRGSELDEALKTLTVSISAKSYKMIEDFCKKKNIPVEEFLQRVIESVAKRIQTQS